MLQIGRGSAITITKVDNSHIRVSATATLADYFLYEAALAESASGLVVAIESQESGGSTIEGLPITVNGVTATGSYNSSTKEFGSLVRTTTGSPAVIEDTYRTKQ